MRARRAALSLAAAKFTAVEAALSRKQIKAAAVFAVQRVNCALRISKKLLVLRQGFRVCRGEVRKQTEAEIPALAP